MSKAYLFCTVFACYRAAAIFKEVTFAPYTQQQLLQVRQQKQLSKDGTLIIFMTTTRRKSMKEASYATG